jgi:hypothetical protein
MAAAPALGLLRGMAVLLLLLLLLLLYTTWQHTQHTL